MTILSQDLPYAVRILLKSPGFAAIAILTLALGIGANTALFSIVDGVLLNPLPYPHSDQLVAVSEKRPGDDKSPPVYLNFLDWRRETQTFASMAIYRNKDYNVSGTAEAQRLSGYMISSEFFSTLGVNPILGRLFRAEDDEVGAAPVVILGGGFWTRAFGASPNVAGKSLVLNGTSYTIVGVIPASFSFYGQDRDVYTPIGQWNDASFRDRRISVSARVVGRLKPGVSLQQAKADMDIVSRDLAAAFPDSNKSVGIMLVPMKEDIVGNVQPFLLVLLAAVGFLLLIACANVANLLLARATRRSREFAVRAALGAGHARIVRQLLTENVLLAVLGGSLGLLIAFGATRVVVNVLPGTLPRAGEVALDGRVLLFTMALSLFAAIIFGLSPALRSSRVDLQEVLRESGRGSCGARHRLQGAFVAVEIAMALVLLIGAGLMLRSLAALWRVSPGYQPSGAITFNVSMPSSSTTTSAETRARLRQFHDKIRAIPGVRAVSVTLGSRPMIHDSAVPFWIEGQPKPASENEMPGAMFYLVEADFEQAMGITLDRGRFISAQDNENTALVIDIDDVFARTYFPDENPIGKRVHLMQFDVQAEIVGVVGHIKQWGPGGDVKSTIQAQFFFPFMQMPDKLMALAAGGAAVVVRTEGDPASIMKQVRSSVQELDSREVVYGAQTMDQVLAGALAPRRLSMILLGVFAGLALVLACVGIYGVVSYLVGQRTHEIGVRIALGAQRGDVMRLVLLEGGKMALVGVVAGLAAAFGLTRLMANQLFGVTAHDPLTYAAVAVLLMLVALFACYVPARRAVRLDPVAALRCE
jgi:putative ABC transport system permease protein